MGFFTEREYGSLFYILKSNVLIGISSSLNFTNGTVSIDGNGVVSYTAPESGGASEVNNEIVSGSGTSFTLANTPQTGTVKLYGAGQRLTPGAGCDYTISGATITIIQTGATYATGTVLADYKIA